MLKWPCLSNSCQIPEQNMVNNRTFYLSGFLWLTLDRYSVIVKVIMKVMILYVMYLNKNLVYVFTFTPTFKLALTFSSLLEHVIRLVFRK